MSSTSLTWSAPSRVALSLNLVGIIFINLSRKQFPKCPESALGAVGIVRGASRGGKTLNYLKPVNVYEEINIFDKWGMI